MIESTLEEKERLSFASKNTNRFDSRRAYVHDQRCCAAGGVAPSTVSKYLNGGCVRSENSDAIREAIAELEYRVNPFARSLKTQRSRFVAVLLPDMTAPFYGAGARGTQ